jgi:RHS repeat-associated protein
MLDDLTNVAYVNRSDGDQYSVLAGQSIDDHLAVVHGNGQIEYGLADALNSTVATVDQNGAPKGSFFYEPFGQTTATNSTYSFQYAGRVPVSGNLYYNRARFYNATTGRFISEDPIGLGGGPNLYRYAANNPVRFIDPLGLKPSLGGLGCGALFAYACEPAGTIASPPGAACFLVGYFACESLPERPPDYFNPGPPILTTPDSAAQSDQRYSCPDISGGNNPVRGRP